MTIERFGVVVTVFDVPLCLICILLTLFLAKKLYFSDSRTVREMNPVLKGSATTTCSMLALHSFFAVCQCFLFLSTTDDELAQDPDNATDHTWVALIAAQTVSRVIGLLAMFSYFLIRLFIAFEYSIFTISVLFAFILFLLISLPILNFILNDKQELVAFEVGIALFFAYGVLVMSMFVRKLIDLILLRTRDIATDFAADYALVATNSHAINESALERVTERHTTTERRIEMSMGRFFSERGSIVYHRRDSDKEVGRSGYKAPNPVEMDPQKRTHSIVVKTVVSPKKKRKKKSSSRHPNDSSDDGFDSMDSDADIVLDTGIDDEEETDGHKMKYSFNVTSESMTDSSNVQIVQVIIRYTLLSVIPIMASLTYHLWQVIDTATNHVHSHSGKHHEERHDKWHSWLNLLLVVCDDTLIVTCVFLNWAFAKRWYWKLCACGNCMCECLCAWYIKREITAETRNVMRELSVPLSARHGTMAIKDL